MLFIDFAAATSAAWLEVRRRQATGRVRPAGGHARRVRSPDL